MPFPMLFRDNFHKSKHEKTLTIMAIIGATDISYYVDTGKRRDLYVHGYTTSFKSRLNGGMFVVRFVFFPAATPNLIWFLYISRWPRAPRILHSPNKKMSSRNFFFFLRTYRDFGFGFGKYLPFSGLLLPCAAVVPHELIFSVF